MLTPIDKWREPYSEKKIPYEEDKCPECGNKTVNQGGCDTCPACGWSKCSIS